MLCGSLCVKYILDSYKIDYIKINKKMKWLTELALTLKRSGLFNIKVFCYNSNLYEDYKLLSKSNLSFDGFIYIKEALNNNIPIIEKRLSINELKREITQNKYIILCVESKVFNNDFNMKGGHFIILNKINKNNLVEVINPTKDKYEIKYLSLDFLIRCCKNYGAWRVIIKEEK